MTNPCEQEDNIQHISRTLERMEKTQERVVDLLEQMANHDARLDHLEEHKEQHYANIQELYNRLHDIELNQAAYGPAQREAWGNTINEITTKLDGMNTRLEKLVNFYRITTSRKAMWVYGGIFAVIIIGALSDLMNHWEWMKQVWSVIRG